MLELCGPVLQRIATSSGACLGGNQDGAQSKIVGCDKFPLIAGVLHFDGGANKVLRSLKVVPSPRGWG